MGMKSMAAGILPVILVSLGLIPLLGLAIPNAAAEEYAEEEYGTATEGYEAFDLGEVVVTPTKTKKTVEDISATVSVITREEIEASGANSVMDILGNLPGVFVKKQETLGRADINIRGIGQDGRRIMVLIDGRPVKVALFGCTVTHSLPLDNVEKIEVVRGPASILYGTDALGGVINIITREAEERVETDLTTSYGTYDTRQYLLRHGGKQEKFDYYITADKKESDGHRVNGGYDGKDYTTKFGYFLTENIKATLSGKYFDGKKEKPGTITEPTPEDRRDYKRSAVDLTFDSDFGEWDSSLKLYHNYGHHQFFGTDLWHHKDYTYGAMFKFSRFWEKNELTTGIDYKKQEGKKLPPQPAGEYDKNEYAFYFLNEHALLNNLILSLGARHNEDSIYGGEFCPHAGLVYHLNEKTSLRTAVNKAFRSPQLNELYMFPPSHTDLEPEEVWNYELGMVRKVADWLTADIVFYQMEGDNLIETRTNPEPPPQMKFFNTGEFSFKGVELGLDFLLGEGLSGTFFYTYLDTGDKTAGRPENKFDLGVKYQKNKFGAYLTGQYVTDLYDGDEHQDRLPDYFVTNVKLTYNVVDSAQLFATVDNILDEDYEIEKGYPMPGTTFTGGVRIEF